MDLKILNKRSDGVNLYLCTVAKFIVPFCGIKPTMALGCRTGRPAYVA